MKKTKEYYSEFYYAGFLDDAFDDKKLKRTKISTCPGGPMTFEGVFKNEKVKIEVCSDKTYWVYSNSQKKADRLAKEIEKESQIRARESFK